MRAGRIMRLAVCGCLAVAGMGAIAPAHAQQGEVQRVEDPPPEGTTSPTVRPGSTQLPPEFRLPDTSAPGGPFTVRGLGNDAREEQPVEPQPQPVQRAPAQTNPAQSAPAETVRAPAASSEARTAPTEAAPPPADSVPEERESASEAAGSLPAVSGQTPAVSASVDAGTVEGADDSSPFWPVVLVLLVVVGGAFLASRRFLAGRAATGVVGAPQSQPVAQPQQPRVQPSPPARLGAGSVTPPTPSRAAGPVTANGFVSVPSGRPVQRPVVPPPSQQNPQNGAQSTQPAPAAQGNFVSVPARKPVGQPPAQAAGNNVSIPIRRPQSPATGYSLTAPRISDPRKR